MLLNVYWYFDACIWNIIAPKLDVYWGHKYHSSKKEGGKRTLFFLLVGRTTVKFNILFNTTSLWLVYLGTEVYCIIIVGKGMSIVCVKGVLCVYCMSIVCILHVYCVYIAYLFSVYGRPSLCILFVCCVCIACRCVCELLFILCILSLFLLLCYWAAENLSHV